MGSFLTGISNGAGTLIGGQGNAGQASSNAWNYGQYSPFTVNNPMGSVGFNGTTANSTLSPLQQQLQTQYGGAVSGGLGQQYNPNTGFLPQQYQNIFNPQNFQSGVNSQFGSAVNGVMPFLQQANASNLDSEFSKGTLASTAGGYQTAGQNMATGGVLSNLYNQSFQNQLGLSNSQFGAANATAGLGEQQAQFGPQLGLQQANAGTQGLNSQNAGFLQMLQQGGNLGAQRSGANVAAATPGIETGMIQDQAQAGLLSGLLFGGGTTGGLLNGLLGGQGSGGGGLAGLLGKAGGGLANLFGNNPYGASGSGQDARINGGYNNNISNQYGGDTSGGGYDWGSMNQQYGDASGSIDNSIGNNITWDFNGASGQAANGSEGNLGGQAANPASGSSSGLNQDLNYLNSANSLVGLGNKLAGSNGSQGLGSASGYLGNALGIYSGFTSGTPQGEAQGAISAANLGARAGLFGDSSSSVGAITPYAAIPLAAYNFANNWKSGATGSDAANGASLGMSVGSFFGPIGTAAGGVIGGAAGALTSLAGGGAVDPESRAVQNVIDQVGAHPEQGTQIASQAQNPYVELAGLMDRHASSLPMYQTYGRMGEQKFTNDLIGRVQGDEAKGMTNPSQIYSTDISPWVSGMGSGWGTTGQAYTQTTQGLLQDMVNQVVGGSYKNNFRSISGDALWSDAPPPPTYQGGRSAGRNA